MKRGFTLLEVNLAMLVMAGGILSIVGLYSFGFRENRQSREDVASAAFAESVISPLVQALGATNVTWDTFSQIKDYPSKKGWYDYFDKSKGIVSQDPTSKARGVFTEVMKDVKEGANGVNTTFPSEKSYGLQPGLVVMHDKNSPIVRIGFRATRTTGALMAQPLYYTEVRFQGRSDL